MKRKIPQRAQAFDAPSHYFFGEAKCCKMHIHMFGELGRFAVICIHTKKVLMLQLKYELVL